MKYTKDDLAKMSDFEINKALATKCLKTPWFSDNNAVIRRTMTQTIFTFNDWNDIMPLAVEHDIIHDFMRTEDGGKLFSAYPATDDENIIIDFWCDTLQRAIACRLILVLQERE